MKRSPRPLPPNNAPACPDNPEEQQSELAVYIDYHGLGFEWYDDALARWFPAPTKATAVHLYETWGHKIRLIDDGKESLMSVATVLKWLKRERWTIEATGHGGFDANHLLLANVSLRVVSEDEDRTVSQINIDLEDEHVLSIYPKMGMKHTTRIIQSLFN